MNKERLRRAEEETLVSELKEKIQSWVEKLKETKGIHVEEEIAFVSPQARKNDGESFILWAEATSGRHLVLESFQCFDTFSICYVYPTYDGEYSRTITISGSKATYKEGLHCGSEKERRRTQEVKTLPKGALIEFNSLLPLPPNKKQ